MSRPSRNVHRTPGYPTACVFTSRRNGLPVCSYCGRSGQAMTPEEANVRRRVAQVLNRRFVGVDVPTSPILEQAAVSVMSVLRDAELRTL